MVIMKTMTIKEIREWYSHRIEFTKRCLPELTDYIINEQKTIEALWKDGYTKNFDNDFAAMVRGYNLNTGDYDITVTDTLNLHTITATKAAVKRFATYLTR